MTFPQWTRPSNISTFQHFIISWPLPTFQHFNISTFHGHFRHFNISTFQHFTNTLGNRAAVLTFQHFNISTFHGSSSTSHGLPRRRPDLRFATPAAPPSTPTWTASAAIDLGYVFFPSGVGFVLFERSRICFFFLRFRVCFGLGHRLPLVPRP